MTTLPSVTLKQGKDFAITRQHPWIFSGAIDKIDRGVVDGDLVHVKANDGSPLAVGHYGAQSIAIRIISFQPAVIDDSFWRGKIRAAIALRQNLGLPDKGRTNSYRLINAEGDCLSGLVVDIYGSVAVIQCHSIGMYRLRELFSQILKEELGSQIDVVYCKSAPISGNDNDPEKPGEYLIGQKIEDPIWENGHKFLVDWERGQKTGFFLDQRVNRNLIKTLAKNKRVLNTFCYTGGFSIYALAAGASSVDSVDSSKRALELLDRNLALNELSGNHRSIQADCMQYLQNIEDKYDLIILDPPAFVKHRKALTGGIKGYETINLLAFQQIAPGGIILTFSCSQHLSRDQFVEAVQKSAGRASRSVRILHQLHAAPCHPISIYHPEGEYLKGLVLYVD